MWTWILGLPLHHPFGKGFLHGSGWICVMSGWPHHSKTILGTKKSMRISITAASKATPVAGTLSARPVGPSVPSGQSPYLQLPAGHFEGQLGDAACGPASCIGGMQLIPDGITVHLQAREQSDRDGDRAPELGKPRSLPVTLLRGRTLGHPAHMGQAPQLHGGHLGTAVRVTAPRPVPQEKLCTWSNSPCTQGLEGVTEKTLVTFFILFYCLTKHLGLIRITSRAEPEPENSSLF